MSTVLFLDTNILLRYIVQDIPEQAVRVAALFEDVAAGRTVIRLPNTVVFESVYVLQQAYSVSKEDIVDALSSVIKHPGVVLDHKGPVLDALDFWRRTGGLSYADCFHLALAADLGFTEICSFDKKMDRYPGVARIEP